MSMGAMFGLFLFVSFLSFQLCYLIYPLFFLKPNYKFASDALEKRISILVPAYNEEAVVKNCIQGMSSLNYSNYETIYINDGSTDGTLPALLLELDAVSCNKEVGQTLKYQTILGVYKSKRFPNTYVIDKRNGGKADSLNAGIDFAKGEIVITLDADSVLEENALNYINREFSTPDVIAAGGMVHVGQMFETKTKMKFKSNGLVKYQLSDYFNSFYLRKSTQAKANVLSIVSGAFGAFRKDVLVKIDGYKKTLGEDMEITLNIQRYISEEAPTAKMIFIPEAICYTEVPENWSDSIKQKTRWQKGFIDCMVKYRKQLFTKAFKKRFTFVLIWDSLLQGVTGVMTAFALPFIFLFHLYDSIFLVLYATSMILQMTSRLLAYGIAARYGFTFRWFDYIKIALFTIVETFTYRLLDPIIFAYGSTQYFLSKDKHNWNKVKRLGTVTAKEI